MLKRNLYFAEIATWIKCSQFRVTGTLFSVKVWATYFLKWKFFLRTMLIELGIVTSLWSGKFLPCIWLLWNIKAQVKDQGDEESLTKTNQETIPCILNTSKLACFIGIQLFPTLSRGPVGRSHGRQDFFTSYRELLLQRWLWGTAELPISNGLDRDAEQISRTFNKGWNTRG